MYKPAESKLSKIKTMTTVTVDYLMDFNASNNF